MNLNQAQTVKKARQWAKENNLVLRKANVLLAGDKAYAFYSRINDERKSRYFTLAILKDCANYSQVGFSEFLN